MEKLQYIKIPQDGGDELQHYIDQDGGELSIFGPVSRVNVLVGATNSGKSRFMRGLVKCIGYYISLSLDSGIAHPNNILNICTRLSEEEFQIVIEISPEEHGYDPEILTKEASWLAKRLKSAETGNVLGTSLNPGDFTKTIRKSLEQVLTDPIRGTQAGHRRDKLASLVQSYRFVLRALSDNIADREWLTLREQGITTGIIANIEAVLDFAEALSAFYSESIGPLQLVYIPVLRTAVHLAGVSTPDTDRLAESIRANYGMLHRNPNTELFTGIQLYWNIREQRDGSDPRGYKQLKDFQRFLGKEFFEGKSIELIPERESPDTEHHLALEIDEETRRQFHDIGDGIQMIIILMYRLFIAEKKSWIFIEEPEQGLHPGLQRIFLKALVGYPDLQERDLTVFFSTHSNHLLGMALSELEDVSVFAFQRWEEPERFEVRPVYAQQQNLLTLLGVTNSSVFLANCGIWVEGITDRKYLRAYLSAYLQSDEFKTKHTFVPQEDVHYAFFEYAGSNLAHYLFEPENSTPSDLIEQIRAQFLCNRIFLLADQDKGKEEKHKRLKEWQNDSFTYCVTPGIEVENLISKDQLLQALPQLISKLTKEDVAEKESEFQDCCDERLGNYLKRILGDRCPDTLVAASGTLRTYYKGRLAKFVCPNVTWCNMSKDAKKLTKALYEFIRKHNQIAPPIPTSSDQANTASSIRDSNEDQHK